MSHHADLPRIVFMGTPEFAVPSLEGLVDSGYTPIAVVTAPDRPRGRGQKISMTPVKKAAIRLGLAPVLEPASVRDSTFAREIRDLVPDIMVVVAFRILPPEVFTVARLGAFNLHGSLLPAYRGAAPIHRAVMAGENRTGVTTFFLEENVDTGNILLQREIPIGPDETTGSVHDRMMYLGADVVVETVKAIQNGTVQPQRQDDTLATPAPKLHPTECRISWSAPAAGIHDHIRGLSPHPGAWSLLENKRLKIYRSARIDEESDVTSGSDSSRQPGTILLYEGRRLIIQCGDGLLELLELQQEGRRRMTTDEFVKGYRFDSGSLLT